MMTISREEFRKLYGRMLYAKFHRVHDEATIDEEYDAYCAITEFAGVDGDISMNRDSSGQLHLLVTPRFSPVSG